MSILDAPVSAQVKRLTGIIYAAAAPGIKADGVTVQTGAITSGDNHLSIGGGFGAADAGKMVVVRGAGAASANLHGWIGSVSGGVAALVTTHGGSTALNAGTTVSGAEVNYASDDTAALQAVVTSAAAKTLAMPDLGAGHIGINGTITSSQPISILGEGVRELYGGTGALNDSNWPTIAPYLEGSVVCQYAKATDVFNLSARGSSQSVRRLGVRFAGAFISTGHGVVSAYPATGIGNIGGVFEDVKVFGQDGDHYAFVLDAPEICRFNGLRGYGGGFMWLKAPNSPGQPGNSDFYNCVGSMFIRGSAHGIFFDGTGHQWNACVFVNVQQGVRVPSPTIPGTLAPTNAQHPIHTTTPLGWTNIGLVQPGWESDVASNSSILPSGAGCFRTNDSFAPVGNPAMSGSPANGAGNMASTTPGIQNATGKPVTVSHEFVLRPAAASSATTLSSGSAAGATSLNFPTTGYAQGDVVTIGSAAGGDLEVAMLASITDATHATVVAPGSWGLIYAHASGATISKGGAIVIAHMNQTNTWPGQWRRARFAAPAGDTSREVSFNFPVPPSYYYRLDWANADRAWTDYPGSFG